MALRARGLGPLASLRGSRGNTWDLIDKIMDAPFGSARNEWNRMFDPTLVGPPSEMQEFDDKFVVNIEAPGIPKENIKLEVKDNVLKVSGKLESSEGRADGPMHSFSSRAFEQSMDLGNDIMVDKIAASAKDGIVSIELPKREYVESSATRVIDIQ
ncbi:Small heat shock protein C4 [Porphyridium purpureum]|uniref:Small heat shock protein C4 n=1 Tax=Porphyridium purpureum TaxID=35688 RepID=A0A5J4Z450_PORPP|nr:Small heat shock protein C4 [Porphyridium purpureum]KAA8498095.1 Small heat shock protein C4 [Porphyridium purpureum]|eukprot:POR0835..scf295_1